METVTGKLVITHEVTNTAGLKTVKVLELFQNEDFIRIDLDTLKKIIRDVEKVLAITEPVS